jgi:hypothetical protein
MMAMKVVEEQQRLESIFKNVYGEDTKQIKNS